MKKITHLFISAFIIILTSCGSNTTKYSPGDTWIVDLTSDISLKCKFEEINNESLLITLSKMDKDEDYNFAIKGNVPCDFIFVNNEKIGCKTTGVIPISYYDVTNFADTNSIRLPFREGTEEYKKIDIKAYDSFLNEDNKSYIGITIILYKY